ncbi:hypothetical protein QFC20_002073 [Naganishia adeliensis]|uniref:Uncharacterized protein n=1 Tax=Naganishia adeliensis TaxID=92952 RepID=A0ACC2WLW3_9TREE|nr:hypothetical protein QFC20_002073 [Naganishia adeliensis]
MDAQASSGRTGKINWSYDDLAMVTSRYFPSGWQHTRILFVDEHANRSLNSFIKEVNPDLTILALFPKLLILVVKDYGDELLSWLTPLRSCLVEVWAPVSADVFAKIQEYPLWWPEHQEDCGKSVNSGAEGVDVPSPGSRLAATLFDLIFAKGDNPEPFSDVDSLDYPESGSNVPVASEKTRQEIQPIVLCTCQRLPFDHIGEICFMPNGFLLQGSGTGRLPSMIRQVHSDIKIFAGWNAADDRIQETLHSVFRVFGSLNYHDVNRARSLPTLLCFNSDIYLMLQFHDRPSISNATFVEIMQRVFDQYMLKLGHISACRSTSRVKRTTLLAIEFPAIKGLKKYRLELASEIA